MEIGTSKVNSYQHTFNFRLSQEMRPIINKYGILGYGMACLILEILTGVDDGIFMLHENNSESFMFDLGCENEDQLNEYLNYFAKVGLIEIESELNYKFISSKVLSELRRAQNTKRLLNRTALQDHKERAKLMANKFYGEKELSKRFLTIKRGKLSAIKARADLTTAFQNRIGKRFPEIEPLKAALYFVDFVTTSDTEYNYYFKEMNKDNFERFFISWLKFYIENNGLTKDITSKY